MFEQVTLGSIQAAGLEIGKAVTFPKYGKLETRGEVKKNMATYGSVSKPCTPVVHIKIAGIYGCSSP